MTSITWISKMIQLVENHKPLAKTFLHQNPNVTWDDVLHYQLPYSSCLCSNPHITWDQLNELMAHKLDWNYFDFNLEIDLFSLTVCEFFNEYCKNPNITWDLIESYPNAPWNYDILSNHPNITLSHILDHPERPWNMGSVCSNPNLRWQDIVNYIPDYQQYGRQISNNPNITLQDILENPEISYSSHISFNSNITPDEMLQHPEIKWCWDYVMKYNPNLSFDFINQHPEVFWNKAMLSMNPAIPFHEIEKIPDWKYHYTQVARNPTITWTDIENHPEFEWDIDLLIMNDFHYNFIYRQCEKKRYQSKYYLVQKEFYEQYYHPRQINRLIENEIFRYF